MDPAIVPRVPAEELREGLQQVLSLYYGSMRRIRKLRRRRSNYASSCAIENLEVDLDRGKHLSLVFKDLSPASLLKAPSTYGLAFCIAPSAKSKRTELFSIPKHLARRRTTARTNAPSLENIGCFWNE
jgi:hypothetical protein